MPSAANIIDVSGHYFAHAGTSRRAAVAGMASPVY